MRAHRPSDDADWRKTILLVSAATRLEIAWWHVRLVELFTETLTGAWRCVDCQTWMFLATMCRKNENLHIDMSCVLIGC